MFRRSSSAGVNALLLASAFSIWELRSAWIGPQALQIPVRKISTRSLRGPAGAGMP